jgi:large subunit ribosomal protein L23
MEARDIIRRPLITEKNTELQQVNKYVFEVDRRANKIEIKHAVEKIFKVKVMTVATSNTFGKRVRFGLHYGRRPNVKKAVVTLKEGDKIELIQGV